MIPPKADAEFVANMEAVLDTYAMPYDPTHPVVCMDEQPVQLLTETLVPIPATKEHPRRVDYEYERAGVASLFLFCEPLAGWCRVTARVRRTKVDRAVEVAALMTGRYAAAEKVILVCDNLNTHTLGAFYEAFDPATARALVRRLEIRHTPKHGSWLNMAEIELSVLSRQCLARRIESREELEREVAEWEQQRNEQGDKIRWQFTTADARIKLRRLYPTTQ